MINLNIKSYSFLFVIVAVVFITVSALLLKQNPVVTPSSSPSSLPDPGTLITMQVYFSNDLSSTGSNACEAVMGVDRQVIAEAPHGQLLRELFQGPTEEEQERGFISMFTLNTANLLKTLKVEDGVAYVNLNDIRTMIPNASASCASAAFFAQVEATLKQDGKVDKVLYAIDGDPEAFYEFMQIGCTEENNNCDPSPYK